MLPHIVSALDISNVSSPTSLPSMLSNCSVSPQDHDNEDGIKSLQVPVWDDKTKARSIQHSTNHDTSLAWSVSLLDGASDHSHPPLRYWNSTLEKGNNIGGRQQRYRRLRQSKEQLKRKHQVQADLLVEKNFIRQLRQSEDDYTQMRTHYEDQLRSLQNQLIDMRCQRDHALGDIEINDRKRKKSNNSNNNSTGTGTNGNNLTTKIYHYRQQNHHHHHQHHVKGHVKQQHAIPLSPPPIHKPIAQQIKEIKLHYEGKIQRLSSKNQEWERNHTNVIHTITTARTHVEEVVRRLRNKMNQLRTEQNQFEQAMKHDNARLRNQLSMAKQEIQQLKSRDITTIRQKKDPHHHLHQHLAKNDSKNHQYIQQLNSVLRKAAADGVILSDTFTLEKMQAKITTAAPATTCLQHSPPPSPTEL